MKKIILSIAVVAGLCFMGCGGSKTDETTSSIPGMMEIEISINDTPLSIMVPDSSKEKLSIVKQSWGATEIKAGTHFQISISEDQGDIALKKSDVADNDVNKFKRYIKDEPTLLSWESEITEPEFHFYTVQKIGAASYLIEDIKEEHFSEADIQQMIDAAKTLKAKEASKPNP